MAAVVGLVGLSMVFYAYWSVPFLLLLVHAFGMQIERSRDKRILAAAIDGWEQRYASDLRAI
jgi:hypothetical protein